MHIFIYNADEGLKQNFRRFAASFDAEIHEGRFAIRPPQGEGFVKSAVVGPELAVFYLEFKLYEASYIGNRKSATAAYSLSIVRIQIPPDSVNSLQLGHVGLSTGNGEHRKAYLASSQQDVLDLQPPGFQSSSLLIMFTPAWLSRHTGIVEAGLFFERYTRLAGDLFSAIVLTEAMERRCEHLKALIHDNGDPQVIEEESAALISFCFGEISFVMTAIERSGLPAQETLALVNFVRAAGDDFFLKPLPRDELAGRLGMIPSRLNSLFTAVYGKPYATYIRAQRMDWALKRLADGDATVGEVADALDYENYSRFTEAFRKHHGLLPSDVLKRK